MTEALKISAALEDYLEAILKLDDRNGTARVRDIAGELSVHKSTVSSALKALAEKGLVEHAPYEITQLTDEGRRIAEQVRHTHRRIKRFLTDILLVDDDVAGENACRLEHVLDGEVLDRMMVFADCLASDKDGGEAFMASLRRSFRRHISRPQRSGKEGA